MLEYIRTHQRLMQFLLLLFIIPSFGLVGIEGYSSFRDSDNAVAKVAGKSITQQEWDAAQREQMERFRQRFGAQFDAKMFDTPEAKQTILDNLIAQRALAAEAARNRLTVSEQSLQQTIMSIPNMRTADGKFDRERYLAQLGAMGMSPITYQANLRQDMIMEQLNTAIQSSAFAPKTVTTQLSDINDQVREVQDMIFKTADYLPQVKVTDAQLQAYYKDNSKQFELPEQVKAEYIVLNSDAVAAQISVGEADIKSYYEQNLKRFTVDELRRASHILINAKSDASNAEKTAAKEKAQAILEKVRKNPADFAKLAKENSQDTGSAERGGDLDFFGKGMMVKPFEEVAFKLKQGEISDLVQSEFGYHIIQLTAITPAKVKPFEEVKAEAAADIKKQLASKKYTELAEIFTNLTYEQADSLKPAADKLNLKIETVANLTRQPNPAVAPTAPYNNKKFLNALFSDDALKNKRNTEAVEVAPNTLIAGRVAEYKPVTLRPFDEVKAVIRERVTQAEATKLAKQAGEAKLAELKSGKDAANFASPKMISRSNGQGLSPQALTELMKADITKLPAYTGVDFPGLGYGVYRINKISQPAAPDKARREAERQQIDSALAQQEMFVYIEYLKKKANVKLLKGATTTLAEGSADPASK